MCYSWSWNSRLITNIISICNLCPRQYCQQKTKKCSSSTMAEILFMFSFGVAHPDSFFRLLSSFQKVNKLQLGKAKKGALSNTTWMPWQYSLFGTLISMRKTMYYYVFLVYVLHYFNKNSCSSMSWGKAKIVAKEYWKEKSLLGAFWVGW